MPTTRRVDLEGPTLKRENPVGSHFWKEPRVVRATETEGRMGWQSLKCVCVFNENRVFTGKMESSRGECGRLCMLLSCGLAILSGWIRTHHLDLSQ